jgi:hypothetical protein
MEAELEAKQGGRSRAGSRMAQAKIAVVFLVATLEFSREQ